MKGIAGTKQIGYADIFIFIKYQPFLKPLVMLNFKFAVILLTICLNIDCFYISKQPIPSLFVNQQFRFNISHNAGQNIIFTLISGPSFVTVRSSGELLFLPRNQGSFQAIIQCINSSTNTNLITLSYVLNVLDRSKEIAKPLRILDQENYFASTDSNMIQIETDSFDFHTPIMTNQNVRLKLNTKNQFGQVIWFYENLPQTMVGGKSTGIIQGYVQNEGSYIIKVTAIDSAFKVGQIYLFLQFNQPSLSLQQDSYSQKNWQKAFLVQQKQQSAKLLQSLIKGFISAKDEFKSKRNSLLNTYRSTMTLRQQNKSIEDEFTQKINLKNSDLQRQKDQRKRVQTDLNSKNSQVEQAKILLTLRQREYSLKVEQSKKINSTFQALQKDYKITKTQFQSVKNDITNLQNLIYNQENQARDIQYEKSRNNVTYITLQKEEVRTREILQIRKNIEFQYLIKKAQTDNKVRRTEDFVFLAQTNYDTAYAEYKKLSLLYFQKVIEGSYLQSQIQLALKDYDQMNKTLNKVKLNYAVAAGAVNTLQVAKEQLSQLSAYALNSAVINVSSTLSDTQLIQAQAKMEVQEYPFAGCTMKGNFAWAGSGKIKVIGRNWIELGTEETVNFGRCSEIKTNVKGKVQLEANQWIQFSGYFWDGAVHATSITILSLS